MKYTYEFSNEENIIEIDKYWLEVLTDLDKAEGANQKKESRRHPNLVHFLRNQKEVQQY